METLRALGALGGHLVTRMIRDTVCRRLDAEAEAALLPETEARQMAVQTALPLGPNARCNYTAFAGSGLLFAWHSGWMQQYGVPLADQAGRNARVAAAAPPCAEAEAYRQAGLRAEALLQEYLSKEQLAALSLLGEFECVGQSGTRYRIRRGHSMNVEELDDQGWVVATLCAYPQLPEGGLPPDSDAMLAQFLLLTTDEPRFLAKAARRAGD